MIENIVFGGGGVKGAAYVGVIKLLEELKLRENIKRVCGSSIGSIFAIFLICDISSDKITSFILNNNFYNLLDNSSIIQNIWRLIFNYGYYDIGNLCDIIADFLEENNIPRDITFIDLFKKYKKELFITSTCINDKKTIFFCAKKTPNKTIIEAMRASISIPFLFEPIELNGKIYIDGGLLCNLPINIFHKIDPNLDKTIGINLSSEKDRKEIREVTNIIDLVELIMMILFEYSQKNVHDKKINHRIITIDTKHIHLTSFDITQEDLLFLFEAGYNTCKKYFQ